MRLAKGESQYVVAAEIGVSRQTVNRHWQLHVLNKEELIRHANLLRPAEALEHARVEASMEPLELCARSIVTLEMELHKALTAGDLKLALQVSNVLREWSVFQAKLTGQLRKLDTNTINLVQNNYGSDARTLEHRMAAALRADRGISVIDFLRAIRTPAPVMIEAATE